MDKIAVLIPCYNEALTVEKVITEARKYLPDAVIYVYDNNSTDDTAAIAQKNGAVVRHEYHQGKGNVIRRMFREIDAMRYLMLALHHDGKIFLTFSASDTGISYCVGMLEISEDEDLLDPQKWYKHRYPVLETNKDLEVYGPGHSCFTNDEDGNTILVFHARKETEIEGDPLYVANRHAMLANVSFDKNGTPVIEL